MLEDLRRGTASFSLDVDGFESRRVGEASSRRKNAASGGNGR
jgi:hypothetical protein